MALYSAPKIIKESIPLLTVLIGVEVLIGQVLNTNQGIMTIPIILGLIPVINGVGGNIGSILGARLASGLHTGLITLNLKDKELRKNMMASFILGIITFFTLGIFSYVLIPLTGIQVTISLLRLMLIIVSSGVLLILCLIVLSAVSAIYSFKKGLDPDNSVTPIVTTSGDALGILCLFLMVGFIGVG